uniref:Nucleolar protein 12 n=1 Tax=Tremella fuciformis TaxID=64657 RepID=D5KY31_9TREE|nr:RRM [Tremella fuciformis]
MSSLSKKQQKAAAFRAKQKGKKPLPEDVPEQDPLVDEEANQVAESSKKRKREEGGDEIVVKSTKGIGKGKAKAGDGWDDEEGKEEAAAAKKKSKKDVKQRFILFVGNLGFKTTRQDIQVHFKPAIDRLAAVRLLTEKPKPGHVGPPKSRGIAFLELENSTELQACLKLHHSILQGRRINVELTAGGGGKGEGRKEKIKERNTRVGDQRQKRAEREAEQAETEGGEARTNGYEAASVPVVDAAAPAVDGESKVKMRGGRRVKARTQPQASQTDSQLPGWKSRSNGTVNRRPQGERPDRRRKFVPTGANAVSVA